MNEFEYLTEEQKLEKASTLTGLPVDVLRRAIKFDKELQEDRMFDWSDVVFYIP